MNARRRSSWPGVVACSLSARASPLAPCCCRRRRLAAAPAPCFWSPPRTQRTNARVRGPISAAFCCCLRGCSASSHPSTRRLPLYKRSLLLRLALLAPPVPGVRRRPLALLPAGRPRPLPVVARRRRQRRRLRLVLRGKRRTHRHDADAEETPSAAAPRNTAG